MATTVKRIGLNSTQIEFPVWLTVSAKYGGELIWIETPKKLVLSLHHDVPMAINSTGRGQLKIHVVEFNEHSSVRMKVMYHLKRADGATFGCDGYSSPMEFTPQADLHKLDHPNSFKMSSEIRYFCQVIICFLSDLARRPTLVGVLPNVVQKHVQKPLPKPVECGHLHASLAKMLGHEKFGDVQFECEGRAFKVSKLFLQAQSDVFDAMFTHDSKEKQSGVIEIRDATAATVERLVRYLYTGRVEEPKEAAADLLPLAVKYQLPELTAICVNALDSSLSLANIIERLELVALYDHLDAFKLRVLTFTKQNYEAVRKLPAWKRFLDHTSGALISELMEMRL